MADYIYSSRVETRHNLIPLSETVCDDQAENAGQEHA